MPKVKEVMGVREHWARVKELVVGKKEAPGGGKVEKVQEPVKPLDVGKMQRSPRQQEDVKVKEVKPQLEQTRKSEPPKQSQDIVARSPRLSPI